MKLGTLIALFMLPLLCIAQKITYSEPEKDDSRSLQFEVIGKVGGNFQVFKSIRNKFAVSVYDNDMKLKDRVDLDFLPEKTINVDFVAYPDFCYLVYEYQKRSVLHCMAAKIDADGKRVGEPVELDTTYIGVFADNKIYSTIHSDDRQQIMIYKIQRRNDKFHFTTLLFNPQLQLQKKSRMFMNFDDRKDMLSDMLVDNDGNFVFIKGVKFGSRELIQKMTLFIKPPSAEDAFQHDLLMGDNYLDEIKLKIDNANNRYVTNAFFYSERRGNIDGIYTGVWDKKQDKQVVESIVPFSDPLKKDAKTNGPGKLAFNDFFIRQVILKKDGSMIITGEDYYTQSRGGSPWNRLDYLYGYPYTSSYNNYISSYSTSSLFYQYRPRSSFGSTQTRYYYDNVVILDIDPQGKLVWSNVIHKSQFDDENDNYLSLLILTTGGELHFLFNELDRKNELIADQSVTPDGKVIRNPTLKSLDKGYQFMPRYGKQVGAKQVVIPCTYRNYICFAKIEY